MDEGAVFIEDSNGWAQLSGLEGVAVARTGSEPPILRKAPGALKRAEFDACRDRWEYVPV